MPLANYRALMSDLVQDRDGVVSSDASDRAVAAAVLRYDRHFPRTLVVDAVAITGSLQALPAGWVADASVLVDVEYPVDESPKVTLPAQLRQRPDGLRIDLQTALTAGSAYRVTYTVPHLVDDVDDTVPASHRYAVACLASAIVCGQLSAYYATEGASTLAADSADHVGKTERFRGRKRDLEAEFARLLGISDKPSTQGAPAGVVVGGDRERPGRLFQRGRR